MGNEKRKKHWEGKRGRKPAPPGRPAPMGLPVRPQAAQPEWDKAAHWYDQLVGEEGSEYQREVVLPGLLRLVAPAEGERVLDVACGTGYFCRQLGRQGAAMTGIDISRQMIKRARYRSDRDVTYLIQDAQRLDERAEFAGQFDAAVCVLAVQNVQDLGGLCLGLHHCLRPQGRVVIVMTHPAFRAPQSSQWGWDSVGLVQYRRVDRYLGARKVKILTHPGKSSTQHTLTCHRPLQDYLNALGASGLLVDRMEEWPSHKQSTSGPRAAAENLAREEIPLFLAIRAVKVSPEGGNRATLGLGAQFHV